MAELDGKATHKDFITPFDAHEQVIRQSHVVVNHVYNPAEFDDPDRGHLAVEYEHQEYPKAVAHDENGEPVLAQNAEHEAELAEEKEQDQ